MIPVLLLSFGCAPFTTLQGPKTLAPGEIRVSGGVSVPGPSFIERAIDEDLLPLGYLNIGMRGGLARGLDAGWQFGGLTGLSADLKGELMSDPVIVSVSGAVLLMVGEPALQFIPALLIGSDRLYIGIKRISLPDIFRNDYFEPSHPRTAGLVQVGGVFGERRQFMPELGLVFAPQGSFLIATIRFGRFFGPSQ